MRMGASPQALHIANPTSLPELHFFGAERLIGPIRQALDANLGLWSIHRNVRVNLQHVLGICFPAAPDVGLSATEDECAICYHHRSEEGVVPECACDGCSKPFHASCLREWLGGLSTTPLSFNRLFGELSRPFY